MYPFSLLLVGAQIAAAGLAVGAIILLWQKRHIPGAIPLLTTLALACLGLWVDLQSGLEINFLGYLFIALVLGWGIVRYRMINLVPRARDSIFDTLADGILILDPAGKIIECNQAARALLSLSPGENNADFQNIIRQQCGPDYTLQHDGMVEIQWAARYEPHYIELLTRPLLDSRQQVSAIIVTLHDFTSRKKAELTAQQERDFAMLIMNTMGEGLTVTGKNLTFEYVNPAYAEMLGMAAHELIGKSPLDFTINADNLLNAHARRQRGEKNTYESRLRRADGQEINVTISGVPRRKGTDIVGAIAVVTDITEQKKAEEALRQSRAQLNAVFENARLGIWMIDTSQRYTFVNKRWAEMVGEKRQALSGQAYFEHVHPYDRLVNSEMIEAILRHEMTHHEAEYRYEHKNGSNFWGALSISPLYDTEGEVDALIGIVADITERKRAETALHETERRFRAILEEVQLLTVLLDKNGNITFCNKHFEQSTGWVSEKIIGQNWFDLLSPGDESTKREFGRAIQRGVLFRRHESAVLTYTGEQRLIAWSNILLRDEKGLITGTASIGEDITARRQTEQAERDQRLFAEALSDTAASMNTALGLSDILLEILENVQRVVPHDAANIALINGKNIQFMRARGYQNLGSTDQDILALKLPIRNMPVIQTMFATHQPVLVPNTDTHPGWVKFKASAWIHSHLSTPIIVDGRMVGAINLDSATSHFFTENHQKRLQAFGAQAAIAFKNATLYQNSLKELQERKKTQLSLRRANKHLQTQLAEIETLQKQLREQAIRDPLTSLFNRRYMEETLARELARAARENLPISIVMLDIDRFKRFNDTHGHTAGDIMLKTIGNLLLQETRRADIACRYGGEEFAIIMPGAPLEIAQQRAERLRCKFAEISVPYEAHTLRGTISLGVATYPEHGNNGLDIIKAADSALYQAKSNGRNRVESAPKTPSL